MKRLQKRLLLIFGALATLVAAWKAAHWQWLAIEPKKNQRQPVSNLVRVTVDQLSWREFFPNLVGDDAELPWFDDRNPNVYEPETFPYGVSGLSAWWFKYSPFDPGSILSASRIKSKRGSVVTGKDAPAMAAWIGTLHSHTGWSDGSGTPSQAFEFGHHRGGLDFMAITDHPEFWLFNEDRNWTSLKEDAQLKTSTEFVAIAGFEYSNPIYGHYIVLGTDGICSAVRCASIDDFYDWLKRPENQEALVAFAHPQVQINNATRYEFRKFEFDPTLKSMLFGVEVIHWSGHDQFLFGFAGDKPYLDEAISNGWLPGSIGSQDNHSFNWGLPNARVGVLAPNLTHDNIMNALRQRRFYATSSRDLLLAFDAKFTGAVNNESWTLMGGNLRQSQIQSSSKKNERKNILTTRLRFFDPDIYHPPRRIEWIMDGKIIGRHDFMELPNVFSGTDAQEAYYAGEIRGTIDMQNFVSNKPHYIYARIFMGPDFETFAQTSPIYIDP